jgi:hypothetical protein
MTGTPAQSCSLWPRAAYWRVTALELMHVVGQAIPQTRNGKNPSGLLACKGTPCMGRGSGSVSIFPSPQCWIRETAFPTDPLVCHWNGIDMCWLAARPGAPERGLSHERCTILQAWNPRLPSWRSHGPPRRYASHGGAGPRRRRGRWSVRGSAGAGPDTKSDDGSRRECAASRLSANASRHEIQIARPTRTRSAARSCSVSRPWEQPRSLAWPEPSGDWGSLASSGRDAAASTGCVNGIARSECRA